MSKLKTYISTSLVSFNVMLEGATKHTHIAFAPLTLKGGMYTTGDERLQKAIEDHRLYRAGAIHIAEQQDLPTVAEPGETAATYGDNVFTPVVEETPVKETNLTFGSLAEAKDHIADTYDVSRTKLRTKNDIEKTAASYGITITWKK